MTEFHEPCCPVCGNSERLQTTAYVAYNTTVEMSSYGWEQTEPSCDMDLMSADQPVTCLECGHKGTAREFGFLVDEGPRRPLEMKTLSVHGRVSLIYCVALHMRVPDNAILAHPYMTAGYAPGQLVLVTLEPTHGMRAFHNAFDADEFDHDLGSAYRWLESHFDEIPNDGFLLDLPYATGAVDKPTTTFEREYVNPWRNIARSNDNDD